MPAINIKLADSSGIANKKNLPLQTVVCDTDDKDTLTLVGSDTFGVNVVAIWPSLTLLKLKKTANENPNITCNDLYSGGGA